MRVVALAALALALAAGAALAGAARNGLPAYVDGYQQWPRLNAKPIKGGSAAHQGTKQVYASKRKVGKRYPYGTVIVKTGVRPGQRYVYLVAVMRKVRGASRANNDWQMIEYTRPSARARFTELARGSVCYSCHVGARSNDYVFTRR